MSFHRAGADSEWLLARGSLSTVGKARSSPAMQLAEHYSAALEAFSQAIAKASAPP